MNLYKGSFGEQDPAKQTDGRNFLYYLAHSEYVPDIFTVQNLDHNGGGYHDCADIARKLESAPRAQERQLRAVLTERARLRACVLYRSSVFSRTDAATGTGAWHGSRLRATGMNSVGVRLRDEGFRCATVSVISVHMPGECTTKNTSELRAWANAGRGSDLRIIAGDFNTNDGSGLRAAFRT